MTGPIFPLTRMLIFDGSAVTAHWDADFSSPRHVPLLAESLAGFPPKYVVSAEKDVLKDDGDVLKGNRIVLGLCLREDGVKSKLDYYPGLPYYFTAFLILNVAHKALEVVKGVRFVLAQGKET